MKLLAFAILNQEVTDLEFNPEPKEGQAMVPGASYIDFRLEKFLKRKKKEELQELVDFVIKFYMPFWFVLAILYGSVTEFSVNVYQKVMMLQFVDANYPDCVKYFFMIFGKWASFDIWGQVDWESEDAQNLKYESPTVSKSFQTAGVSSLFVKSGTGAIVIWCFMCLLTKCVLWTHEYLSGKSQSPDNGTSMNQRDYELSDSENIPISGRDHHSQENPSQLPKPAHPQSLTYKLIELTKTLRKFSKHTWVIRTEFLLFQNLILAIFLNIRFHSLPSIFYTNYFKKPPLAATLILLSYISAILFLILLTLRLHHYSSSLTSLSACSASSSQTLHSYKTLHQKLNP
jgi:hypothetical protein